MQSILAQTQGTALIAFDPGVSSAPATAVFANGVALSNSRTGSTAEVARGFLTDNAGLFGVDGSLVNNLVETASYVTGNGLRVTELTQYAGGFEVFNSEAKVGVDGTGRVVSATSSLQPGLVLAATTPRFTEASARLNANAFVGAPLINRRGIGGRGSAPDPQEPPAKLYAYPVGNQLHLAYAIQVESPTSPSVWLVLIDAQTGAPLFRKDLVSDAGPEGQVFPQNPTVPCTAGTLPCGQSAAIPFNTSSSAPYSLDATHNDWVTATDTQGNNVTARDSSTQPTTTPSGPVTTAAGAAFDFAFQDSWELSGTPSAQDIDGAVTNLFYQNNYMHDWMYTLGFTEAARNFQTNNFALGGTGGDAVNAGAMFGRLTCPPSLGTCRNNANFFTPADGTSGIMRMYLFVPGNPQRDGDLDGDVISHEFGHGVSNRLIGNGSGLTGTQGDAMGEGWSDYWAITRYNDPLVGEFVTGNTVRGIRNFPYNAHPWTYGHLCTGGCEEHNDGEIWAATLWDLRTKYRTLMGAAPGTSASDQVVFDGIALTPNAPSMLNARDAILAAEAAAPHVGVTACDLWTVFAARGMGFSATSVGNGPTVTEKFDVAPGCPTDMSVVKTATSPAGTVTPGTAVTYELVITNNGPGVANTPVITDVLPYTAGLTIDVHGNPWTCPAPVGNTLTCTRTGTMAIAAVEHITITITTSPTGVPGTVFNNTATVSVTQGDPVPANDSSTAAKTFAARISDLGVVKTADRTTPIIPGTTVIYQLAVTNTGPSDATASLLKVVDTLPAGFAGFSLAPGSNPNWSCVFAAPTLTCSRSGATMPVGTENIFFQITSDPSALPPGNFVNSVQVNVLNTAPGTQAPDPNAANNTSSATNAIGRPTADLQVNKANPLRPAPGQLITYRIRVRNSGPSTSRTVHMEDQLPAGYSFEGWLNGVTPAGCAVAGTLITCDTAIMLPNTSYVVTFLSRAPNVPDGLKANVATVASKFVTFDPNLLNNRAVEAATLP